MSTKQEHVQGQRPSNVNRSLFVCFLDVCSFLFVSLVLGIHLKAVFWPGIMVSTQISRSRFKQSKISHPRYLRFELFGKFLGDFWTSFDSFFKGLEVKFY